MAWTDYPIEALGDKPYVPAPVRRVRILGWDDNKYCLVQIGKIRTWIKAGYLYTKPGRLSQVPKINTNKLKILNYP